MKKKLFLMLVVLGMLAGSVSAAYLETFESGYTAGLLVGQNGWESSKYGYPPSGYSPDPLVASSTTVGDGWGVAFDNTMGNQGAAIAHGVASTSADTVYASADFSMAGTAYPLFALSGPGPTWTTGVRVEMGANYWVMSYMSTTSGDTGAATTHTNAGLVAGEKYNVQLSANDDAQVSTLEIFRYSTGTVIESFEIGVNLGTPFPAYVQPTHVSLQGYVGAGGTIDWDNVRVGLTAYEPVPEPATMVLLSLGGLLLRKKR